MMGFFSKLFKKKEKEQPKPENFQMPANIPQYPGHERPLQQPYQPPIQPQLESDDKEFQVLSSKLDILNAKIDSLHQQMRTLEERLREEEKPRW